MASRRWLTAGVAGGWIACAPAWAVPPVQLDRELTVAASATAAWAVLTDYDHMADFVPGLVSSTQTRRSGARALVAQEASAQVLLFSRRIHVLLDVREEPCRSLTFEDTARTSFRAYRGSWVVSPAGIAGIRLAYHVEAEPAFWAPAWAVRRFLGRTADDLLREVSREILRRAAASGPADGGQPSPPASVMDGTSGRSHRTRAAGNGARRERPPTLEGKRGTP
jgi:carbon monoxide dehydrogenase subunit G